MQCGTESVATASVNSGGPGTNWTSPRVVAAGENIRTKTTERRGSTPGLRHAQQRNEKPRREPALKDNSEDKKTKRPTDRAIANRETSHSRRYQSQRMDACSVCSRVRHSSIDSRTVFQRGSLTIVRCQGKNGGFTGAVSYEADRQIQVITNH